MTDSMVLPPFHGILGEEEEVLKKRKSKCTCVYLHICTKRKSRATELSAAPMASVAPESMRIFFTGVDQRSVYPVSKTSCRLDSQERARTGQPYMTHLLTVLLISGCF